MRPGRRRGALAWAILVGGCATSEGASLATVTVDTLPGGVERVVSAGPTAWTDSSGWRLVEDGGVQGEPGTPGELVNPRDHAVDERGFVYVVDSRPEVIKVYDADGRFVRTVGGEGAGPGEFRTAFIAVRGGRLVVHDPQVSRVSVFDTSGTYLRSWIGTCCYWDRPTLDLTGRVAIPMEPPGDHNRAMLRFDSLGAVLDTLVVPQSFPSERWRLREGSSMRMSTPVPFAPRMESAFAPDGRVLHAWSGAYAIAIGPDGDDTTRVFGRAWTAEPVGDSVRDKTYEDRISGMAKAMQMPSQALRTQFEKERIPANHPAFAGVSVDDRGNAWVHVREDSALTRFDVFDAGGAYLGPVTVPRLVQRTSTAWGRDALYVRAESEEGYPRIVRYRVVRPD